MADIESTQSTALKSRGTNVNIFSAGGIAIVLTLVTCFLIVPLKGTNKEGTLFRVWEVCLDRGVVSPGTIFLSYWAAVILAFKYKKVAQQRASVLVDLLPTSLGQWINKGNVDAFMKHVATLPFKPGQSEYVDRVRGALEHFKLRNSRSEVEDFLSTQKELDGTALTQSYTMVNVLCWAIPILGFIGTVQGIAVAVSSFQRTIEVATELSVLKDSLKGVTYGLAIAFDTTLIGLLLSLVVVFPAKMMEKTEEDTLGVVEDYTHENLLKRLVDSPLREEAREETSKEWVKNAVAAAMAAQEAEFRLWTKHLREAGTAVTQSAVEGWQTVNQQLRESQIQQAGMMKAAQETQAKQYADSLGSLNEIVMRTQQQITGLQESQLRGYKDTVASLAGNLQTIQEQGAKRAQADAAALKDMATDFGQTLDQLRNQAAREQEDWTKYFENIGKTITGRIVEGWETIDKRMKESLAQQLQGVQSVAGLIGEEKKGFIEQVKVVQDAQVKHFAETVASLDERSAAVQKQIAEFQENQVRGFKDAVGSLGTNLKTIQEEAHRRNEADAGALRQMVTSYVESLNSLREQSKSIQQDMAESMRNAGPAFREELRQISTEVGEAFGNQLKSLDQIRQNIESGAEKFVQRMEEVRSAQTQGVTETARVLRETAQGIQKDLAATQEQPVRRLQEIAQALAESARTVQKDMDTARENMREEARKSADQANRTREDAARAAGEQLSQLSTAAERMLGSLTQSADRSMNGLGQATDKTLSSLSQATERATNMLGQAAEKAMASLGKSLETAQEQMARMEAARGSMGEQELSAIKSEREALERASAEQLSKVNSLGTQLVNSMVEAQKKTAEDNAHLETARRTLAEQELNALKADREAAERAAAEQLSKVNSLGTQLVNSMVEAQKKMAEDIARLETARRTSAEQELNALKAEREAGERAAADQLAKVTHLGNQIMNSMVEGQKKMGEQINALVAMLESQDKLRGLQQTLASNLEVLATSDGFKKTLSGIDTGLGRLHSVLKELSDRAGLAWAEGSPADGEGAGAGGGRKWWRLGKRG